MENLIYIFAFLIIISFIRCRSHTQKQFRIEIINDLGVNIVRTVVSLIQNNAIKGIWLILKQMCISVQSLYCCKNIILLIFIEACSHQSHCHFLIKNFFKRFFSLLRKCYTMNQKQYSFETKLTHSKCGCICLSCSSRGDQQRPLFSLLQNLPQVRNKSLLHRVWL